MAVTAENQQVHVISSPIAEATQPESGTGTLRRMQRVMGGAPITSGIPDTGPAWSQEEQQLAMGQSAYAETISFSKHAC